MNKIITTFIFQFFIFNITNAQQRFDHRIWSEGLQREFIVALPSGNVPTEGYPVVFMFHGTGGQGDKFYEVSQWKELGQREKVLTVYPSALRYCIIDNNERKITTKWNCKDIPEILCEGQEIKDDVAFFKLMLDTLQKMYPINPKKIYVSGFSNGSCFGSKVSLEVSNRIAAYGGCSAFLGIEDTIQAHPRVPMWLGLGTKDNLYINAYGVDPLPFSDSILVLMRFNIRKYLYSLGLQDRYTRDSGANYITYHYTSAIDPKDSAEFHFTLVKGMTHQYPNGDNHPTILAEVLWPFFKDKCRLPNISTHTNNQEENFEIHPNPVTDFLYLDNEIASDISILDTQARLIYYVLKNKENRIDVSHLMPGNYFILIKYKDNMKAIKFSKL